MKYATTCHARTQDGMPGQWRGTGITALLLAGLLSLTACSHTEPAPIAEQVFAAHQTSAVLHELSAIKLVKTEGLWVADVVFDTEIVRFSWREGTQAPAAIIKTFSRSKADDNQIGTPVLNIVPYANVEKTIVRVNSDWAREHAFDQVQRAALLKAAELIYPATEVYLNDKAADKAKADRTESKSATGGW